MDLTFTCRLNALPEIDESEEDRLDLPVDEINWVAMCELAVNTIVKEHLERFIDRAFKEQLEYL